MRWSLTLGKIFGINVKVHWTFWLLIAWVVIAEVMRGSNTLSVVLTTFYVLSIFACVVFHEFGHALTARQFGIPTKKITLLPIGGIASLQRIPENPRQELLVAVAGPLVNVAIAGIIYPFLGPLESYIPQDESAAQALTITPENFWFFLFSINVLLVLFNLLPAFPMDGGRMLRSVLAMNMNRMKATAIASSIGQFLAVVFFFAGLFLNPFLLLIGVFVFFGAKGENMMVQQYEVLKNHIVEEAMLKDVPVFDSSTDLKAAADHLLTSTDDTFLISDEGDVKGWISRDDIIKGLNEHGPEGKVSGIIKKDFEILRPNDRLSKVLELMQSKKQNIFPIMENGKLKGVLNSGSLQNFIAVQSALDY